MVLFNSIGSAFFPFIILFSSLLGSLHCAGMCGGLVLAVTPTKAHEFFYHFGRLLGYLFLGALLGGLGELLGFGLLQIHFNFFSIISALAMGGVFLWVGFELLLSGQIKFSFGQFLRLNFKFNPRRHTHLSSLFSGIATAFLPCGWLHGFLMIALAMQSVFKGALTLFLFWLGTVPALSFSRRFILKLTGPQRARLPKIVGLCFICVGLITLFIRLYPILKNDLDSVSLQTFHEKVQCIRLFRKDY